MKLSNYIALPFIMLMVLAGLSACEEPVPDNLLGRDEMVKIIKDLQLAYAGVDVSIAQPAEKEKKYDELNVLVLEKHKMDKDVFFSSYQWYLDQPILMDSIYTQVIENLTTELDALQSQSKKRQNAGKPGKK